jgi:two-component system KDP operon response regulator KdpE
VRAKDSEKVFALDNGANDYVVKPFSIEELLARVRVALRARLQGVSQAAEVVVGELVVDVPKHKVSVSGQDVKLTRKEFELLKMLAQNAGRIVTHRQILREVWGPAHLDDVHYLRIYIGHLRQKLGDDPANPQFIESEPGVGYRMIMHAA